MSNGDKLIAELAAASEWTRAEKLEAIERTYGAGFARVCANAAEAKRAEWADQERKQQGARP